MKIYNFIITICYCNTTEVALFNKTMKSDTYLGHKYRISSVVLMPAHNQKLERYQCECKASVHSLEGTPIAKGNHPHHDADKWQGQHQHSQEH